VLASAAKSSEALPRLRIMRVRWFGDSR